MKLNEFCSELRKKGIRAAVFMSTGMNSTDTNIDYFAGFNCEYCCLVIRSNKKGNKAKLFVPKHELLAAKKGIKKGVRVLLLAKKKNIEKILKKELKNVKKIGVNKKALSVYHYERLRKITKAKLADVSDDVAKLRAVKTKEEIKNIQKACSYADRILEMVVKNFKQFRTEADISAFILSQTRLFGLEPSFEPVVASGDNAAEVHHKINNKKLKKGFLIIDMGVKYKGYCSDITRTFYIGKLKKADKALYENVVAAQHAGVKAVKPGAKVEDVDAAARKVIGKYNRYFTHGIGHSIGLDIHDDTGLKEKEQWILKENNIITIEPGIYLKNRLGIRIEDTVWVTKKGPRILTKFKKDL